MFKNKRALIGMWSDVLKGFFAGVLVTAIGLLIILSFKLLPAINKIACGVK